MGRGERERMRYNPYFAHYGKSTWIIELNIKPKAIKLVGENLCDLGLDTDFLEHKKHKQ